MFDDNIGISVRARPVDLDQEELRLGHDDALAELRWLARRCRECGDPRGESVGRLADELAGLWHPPLRGAEEAGRNAAA